MSQELLKAVAKESLAAFEEIEDLANQKLAGHTATGQQAVVNANTMSGWAVPKGTVVKSAAEISAEVRDAYRSLVSEPAIARIEVEDEEGKVFYLFISRKSSLLLKSGLTLASYDSPLGRVASFAVGDDGEVVIRGKRQRYYVREKTSFHPEKDAAGWDSVRNVWKHEDDGTLSIESLRRFLAAEEQLAIDALDAALAADTESGAVQEGIAHQVRTAMALRDQPILDKFQDDIFRLPIDSQLIILGPPGTGKTTTLIKRLGQKISIEGLEEAEQTLAGADTADGLRRHRDSWVMFTPSELLRHYLKEAFSREQVPASDNHIRTWERTRQDLARNVLSLLKTATGGRFTQRREGAHLLPEVQTDPRQLFDAFQMFHRERVVARLREGLAMVESATADQPPAFLAQLVEVVNGMGAAFTLDNYASLLKLDRDIEPALKESVDRVEKRIRGEANLLINLNREFLKELGAFIDSLQSADDEEDDESEFDADSDDSVTALPVTGVRAAYNAYEACIRTIARSRFRRRSVSKGSRAGRIREWLGDRVPADEVLLEIGRVMTYQNGLRRFRNAWRRHVMDVGINYRPFRKAMQAERRFYSDTSIGNTAIDTTELDLLVLAMLRNARELLAQDFVRRDLNNPRYTELARINNQMRNQVLVDEATDFSVLQLACMEALASPRMRSFFACGDFNQRITGDGIRSLDQVRWLSDRLVERRINTVYRQSATLNGFARQLLEVQGGDITTLGELPADSRHDGVAPMLLEHSPGLTQTAAWLANRIREIEQAVRVMPTIAVLVGSEADVEPTAEALNACLDGMSLQARACRQGEVLGDNNDVRVFDVRHIKGLEFEAVFFVNIDLLAIDTPELFDRYLYVGATRAATYLGITCGGELPSRLASLKPEFNSIRTQT